MMISFIGMLFLYGLAAMGLNLANSERVTVAKARSQRSAELAMNYILSRFSLGDENPYLPSSGQDVATFSLPADVIPDATVRFKVRRFNSGQVSTIKELDTNERFYRSEWDPNNSKTDWVRRADQSYFFIVQVTAVSGAFPASVQATLRPSRAFSGVPPSRSSGVVASGSIGLGSGDGYLDVLAPGDGFSSAQTVTQDGYASFKTAVQSNTGVTLNPGVTVYGDLLVNNSGSADVPVAQSSNAQVFGRLQANATDGPGIQGLTWTNGTDLPSGTDNVLGMADAFSRDFSDLTRVGLNKDQAGGFTTQPASSVEANPVVAPNNSIAFPGFPSASGADSLVLSGGNYRTSNFDTSTATANLSFDGPTKIYIDDKSSDDIVIDSTKIRSPGSASDLQIFYTGEKTITIRLDGDLAGSPELQSVIYAPRAKVVTSGFGEFYGAILAKNVEVSHIGDLRLDPNASSLIVGQTNQSTTKSDTGEGNQPSQFRPNGYILSSWQQVSGALVPTN